MIAALAAGLLARPWARTALRWGFIAGCWRQRLAGLILATPWLAGCAMGSSDALVAVCPSVVEYSPEFQARAADELVLLTEESALMEMLSDYAVMRDQARACRSG